MAAELQHSSSLDKTLLNWCRLATRDYADVDIANFTTSWSDGLAFVALIHRFRPDLFDYDVVSRKAANARLEHAFRTAHKALGIARLLDPEGCRPNDLIDLSTQMCSNVASRLQTSIPTLRTRSPF